MRFALITGTRRDTRAGACWAYLDEVKPDAVIAGGARGIDAEARLWTQQRGAFLLEAPAPWRPQAPRPDGLSYDPTAGMKRNQFMAVVAAALKAHDHELIGAGFPDKSSIGTFDALRRFRALAIPVESR